MKTDLSSKAALILRILTEAPEQTGAEIVQASKKQIGKGTVYVRLDRLESDGFVRTRDLVANDGRLPRTVHSVTPEGRSVLAEHIAKGRAVGGKSLGQRIWPVLERFWKIGAR